MSQESLKWLGRIELPFDAIEATYGLNQNQVEDLMRDNLKKNSYTLMEKESPRKKNETCGLERIWC